MLGKRRGDAAAEHMKGRRKKGKAETATGASAAADGGRQQEVNVVSPSPASPPRSSADTTEGDQRRLFISGLPFSFVEADLETLCRSAAEGFPVDSLELLRFSGSRRCNGQAFVTFATAKGAQACMHELDGALIENEKGVELTLSVMPSLSKKQTTLQKKRPKVDDRMASRCTFIYEGQGAAFVMD